MNLVRGVALIAMVGVCGAAPAPDPVNSLAEKSGSRVPIVGMPGGGITLQAPVTLVLYAAPKGGDAASVRGLTPYAPPASRSGGGLIPTEIHAKTELIPTQLPDVKLFLCNH
jgi:hypothetical protein